MAAKEFYFGGLPASLFDNIVIFLEGTAEVAAARSVLASLAREEHSAASSTVEVSPIDAVFKIIEVNDAFKAVQSASASTLVAELANLKLKVDNLEKFWSGK